MGFNMYYFRSLLNFPFWAQLFNATGLFVKMNNSHFNNTLFFKASSFWWVYMYICTISEAYFLLLRGETKDVLPSFLLNFYKYHYISECMANGRVRKGDRISRDINNIHHSTHNNCRLLLPNRPQFMAGISSRREFEARGNLFFNITGAIV